MPRSPTRQEEHPPDDEDTRSTGPIIVPVAVITRETRIVPVMPVIVTPPMQPRVIVEPPEVDDNPRPTVPMRAIEPRRPEVAASSPVPTSGSKPAQKATGPVEKATEPVQKATGSGKKQKDDVYDGELGRKHTELQIEEILDFYLQTGLLPTYVTQKMRWNYKHHRRLPERRELLERAGTPVVVPEAGGVVNNITPIKRTNVHSA